MALFHDMDRSAFSLPLIHVVQLMNTGQEGEEVGFGVDVELEK